MLLDLRKVFVPLLMILLQLSQSNHRIKVISSNPKSLSRGVPEASPIDNSQVYLMFQVQSSTFKHISWNLDRYLHYV